MSGQTPETMGEWVAHWAQRTPDAPVLVEDGRAPLSYAALAKLCEEFRSTLNACGYGRNDRIAIVHPGGADNAAAIAAIWSCATAVPLNPDFTVGEFGIHLKDLRADLVVVAAEFGSPARDAASHLGLPIIELVHTDERTAGMVALRGGEAGEPRLSGPAQREDLAMVLFTSGTTSRGKIVPIRHRHVAARNANVVRCLELTADDVGLALNPLFHYSAIGTSWAGNIAAGASAIFMPRFIPDVFFRHLEVLGPTWCAGAYTFHQRIHALAPKFSSSIQKARLRFIRASTGRLDPESVDALERVFGVPVITTYATTETGLITVPPLPPGNRKRGSVGLSVGGAVAIMGRAGEMLPSGERGEVVVRGPHVFDGYENDPGANAAAFVDGWFRTGDEGVLDEDGYLTLTGRIKEIINRGGEKVSPAEVEEVLATHHEVERVVVFPMPHPTLGEEVAAAVVLKPWAGIDAAHLTRLARRHMAGFKVPRKFVFVDDIPTGPMGKIQRSQLAAVFGLEKPRGPLSPVATEPDREPTPLEAKLAAMWARTLGVDHVGLDDDFFLLGGDSLQAMDLFLEIERELGQRLPGAILFEAGTVAELARRIETESPPGTLVAIQPEGDLPPLFCAPGGSENALVFSALSRHLGKDQPLYGIRFRAQDGTGQPFLDLDTMAAHCIEAIREVQPTGRYHLVGFSFGGRLAYIMAQQLRASGEEVAFLALFDTYCFKGSKRLGVRERLAFNLAAMRGMRPIPAARFAFARAVAVSLKPVTSLRLRLYAAARRVFADRHRPIPKFLADAGEIYLAINARTRLTPYDGPVVLFKAKRAARVPADAHDGWRDLIGDGLEVVPTPGGHYDILREPHIQVLVRELQVRLRQARERQSPIRSAEVEAVR